MDACRLAWFFIETWKYTNHGLKDLAGTMQIKTADVLLKKDVKGQVNFMSKFGPAGWHGEATVTGSMLELLDGIRNRSNQRHSAVSHRLHPIGCTPPLLNITFLAPVGCTGSTP